METICQPQCDGSWIAGRGMSALPRTSPLGMKLEERDEVHHGVDASGRNMILNRATYTCTIITITIISPLTDETEVLLHARLSTQPSPRCLAWSYLSILWYCSSNYYVVALTYVRNRRCSLCWIVCIGYSAESHGQTISASKPYQLPLLANGTRLSTLHHTYSFVMCSNKRSKTASS